MKRRAIILCCHGQQGGGLEGPRADAENMYQFLTSDLGGAWDPKEIRCLENPTRRQVEQTVIQFTENAHSTLVYYGGQGAAPRSGKGRSLLLADGPVGYGILKCEAERQTILIDSDRTETKWPEGRILEPEKWQASHKSKRGEARAIYDADALYAGRKQLVVTGCNHQRNGIDTPQGGAFTLALLKVAELFANGRTEYNLLEYGWAISRVKTWMKKAGLSEQVPTLRHKGGGKLPLHAVKPWHTIYPSQGGATHVQVDVGYWLMKADGYRKGKAA